MNRFVSLLMLTILTFSQTLLATAMADDQLAEKFDKQEFTSSTNSKLLYRMLSPTAVKAGETYPLVVFLHGAGERGSDNSAQLVHVVQELATEAMQNRYPAYVIAPQCPENDWWGGNLPQRLKERFGREIKFHVPAVLELVDRLKQDHAIDPSRVYIVGLSMGGFGTWDAIRQRPELFAAAAPICSGGFDQDVQGYVHLPIWIFHGEQDPVVPAELSRTMVKALKSAGGQPIYTEYPGVDHDSWTITAKNPLFWDWLFAQSRDRH